MEKELGIFIYTPIYLSLLVVLSPSQLSSYLQESWIFTDDVIISTASFIILTVRVILCKMSTIVFSLIVIIFTVSIVIFIICVMLIKEHLFAYFSNIGVGYNRAQIAIFAVGLNGPSIGIIFIPHYNYISLLYWMHNIHSYGKDFTEYIIFYEIFSSVNPHILSYRSKT